jgi:hypothetical protein
VHFNYKESAGINIMANMAYIFSGVFSTGAMGALAPAILEQSITVTAL